MFDSGGFLESSNNASSIPPNKKTTAKRMDSDSDIGMESDSDADTDLDEEWATEEAKPHADSTTSASSHEAGADRSSSYHSPASDHAHLPTTTDSSDATLKDAPPPENSMTSIVVKDAK
jgi:hypothetical protein